MGVSEDNADQDDDESDSDCDSWESATNSCSESATGDDCLTCLDTKKAIIKSAHKKFCKKVQASWSSTKQGLWKDA